MTQTMESVVMDTIEHAVKLWSTVPGGDGGTERVHSFLGVFDEPLWVDDPNWWPSYQRLPRFLNP